MIFTNAEYPQNYNPADYPSFKYLQDFESTPTESIKRLLAAMDAKKMEFFTNEAFDSKDFRREPFIVHTVKIISTAQDILYNLEIIRPTFIAYINHYMDNDESLINKKYELQNCAYLIKEFMYLRNVKKTMYYDSSAHYKITFKSGNQKEASLPATCFIFTDEAGHEFEYHHQLRQDFLDIISEFIGLSIERLKVFQTEIELNSEITVNIGNEKKLLTVWLSLKAAGFMQHVPQKQHLKYRTKFFEIFNLTDRNYNDNHANWKKDPKKGEFLQYLINLVHKEAIERRKKPPKNKKPGS